MKGALIMNVCHCFRLQRIVIQDEKINGSNEMKKVIRFSVC